MRKLVEVIKIDEVIKHPNADSLDICKIGGWNVITRINEYKAGDIALYAQIDSWIPSIIAPFLSRDHEPRIYNDVPGERLKTIKLRGEVSQGLLLSPSLLSSEYNLGDDVSELLGIQKWEPVEIFGCEDQRSTFPSWARKTDQERIQSCYNDIKELLTNGLVDDWTVEEKLEGSSMSVGSFDNDPVICSRNMSLKLDCNSKYVETAKKYNIVEKLNTNIMISGELCGPGIQGNIYNLSRPSWFIFDIFDVDKQSLVSYELRKEIIESFDLNLHQTPVIKENFKIQDMTCQELLEMAKGKSLLNYKQDREGLVFKNNANPNISFKAINNDYLLKQKD